MLTSLALIFLVGLAMAALCQMIRLPRIIGMLLTGILLGPYVLNLLDDSILMISADLREMALVIILIKAGLSLKLQDLKAVGRPALMMSFVPASFEIVAYTLFAPLVLGLTRVEAAVMGSVLAAVSPAVVVPRMVQLMEEGRGTKQHIPQMILAGASLDDVFVIVLFSTFTGMAQGGTADLGAFAGIPVSIVLGIAVGAVSGVGLAWFFETRYARSHKVRGSVKVIIVLGAAFLLTALEDWLTVWSPSPDCWPSSPWPALCRCAARRSSPGGCLKSSASCGWRRKSFSSCWWARQWTSAIPSPPVPVPW